MKKIGKLVHELVEKKLKDNLKDSDSLFMVQYSGLSSVQMTLLRSCLKETNSRVIVAKNSLVNRVLKDAKIEGLDRFITGPTAIIFGPKDISLVAKVLVKFQKENANLNLGGAFFQDRILNKKDIEAISSLPSRDVLLSQLVMTLQSPIANLVFTLKGNLNKLVIALNQIKEKKNTTTKT